MASKHIVCIVETALVTT